jgi:predicted nucleotidyltransferase
MPIDINRFESNGRDGFRDRSTSERIVRFLLAHDDSAFTRSEIAEAVDVNPETVGTNLTRLKNRGLVRHREPYWALTDDTEHAIETVRDQYGDADLIERLEQRGRTESDSDTDLAVSSTQSRTDANISGSSHAGSTGSPVSAVRDTNSHREAATAFFDRVRGRLDTSVETLYLFGSVARKDASAESDVDVLAVVADTADYAVVDDRLLDIAYDVQLAYGVRVEVHLIRATEFEARKARGDPFVQAVLEEGTPRV